MLDTSARGKPRRADTRGRSTDDSDLPPWPASMRGGGEGTSVRAQRRTALTTTGDCTSGEGTSGERKVVAAGLQPGLLLKE